MNRKEKALWTNDRKWRSSLFNKVLTPDKKIQKPKIITIQLPNSDAADVILIAMKYAIQRNDVVNVTVFAFDLLKHFGIPEPHTIEKLNGLINKLEVDRPQHADSYHAIKSFWGLA